MRLHCSRRHCRSTEANALRVPNDCQTTPSRPHASREQAAQCLGLRKRAGARQRFGHALHHSPRKPSHRQRVPIAPVRGYMCGARLERRVHTCTNRKLAGFKSPWTIRPSWIVWTASSICCQYLRRTSVRAVAIRRVSHDGRGRWSARCRTGLANPNRVHRCATRMGSPGKGTGGRDA